MRAAFLIVCLTLLVAGTVLAPGVAAKPLGGTDDDCVKPSSTGVHKACGKTWVVSNMVACLWNGSWREVDAGPVVYREYYCNSRPGSDPW